MLSNNENIENNKQLHLKINSLLKNRVKAGSYNHVVKIILLNAEENEKYKWGDR